MPAARIDIGDIARQALASAERLLTAWHIAPRKGVSFERVMPLGRWQRVP